MTAAWTVAFVAVATLSFLTALVVLGLLRRMSVAIQGVEQQVRAGTFVGGVPTGWFIPPFNAKDREGRSITSAALLRGPGILLMLSSDCDPCRELLEEMQSQTARPTTVPLFAVLEEGDLVSFPVLPGVNAYIDETAFRAMNINATPLAMAFDQRGVVVARSVPNTIGSLRELEGSLGQEVVTLVHSEG